MTKLKVDGYDQWNFDEQSGSVECIDNSEYAKYMRRHKAEQEEKIKQAALQKDVSMLKSEMSDIKSLLLTLVNSNKGS
tara:strand:+ start:5747 stop:5980 length:234 start_codon:yes stop_codon:yes gene_type:complete